MHSLHVIVAYGLFGGALAVALIGMGTCLYEICATRRHIKRRLREIQERAGK